jgi:hypothetical protein
MPGTIATTTTTQQGQQGNQGDQNPQGQGQGQGADPGQNAPQTVSIEEYNRMVAERNHYAQQATQPKDSGQQKKDPFEGYTDDQLINMKYDPKTAQYAALIDTELHKRNRDYAANRSQHSVNSKINEIAAVGLHQDMKNPASPLYQRYQQILNQEMPFLKEQVNGAIIAAKMALGELSLSTQALANSGNNNGNNATNATQGQDGVVIENTQQRTNLRGSGQSTNAPNKKLPSDMSDDEFETFVQSVKMAGYEQG